MNGPPYHPGLVCSEAEARICALEAELRLYTTPSRCGHSLRFEHLKDGCEVCRAEKAEAALAAADRRNDRLAAMVGHAKEDCPECQVRDRAARIEKRRHAETEKSNFRRTLAEVSTRSDEIVLASGKLTEIDPEQARRMKYSWEEERGED